MGRLSEYINGSRGRSVFLDSGSKSSSVDIEISGIVENSEMLGRLMTVHPEMAKNIRTVIRKALQIARKNLSRDAASYMDSDPRKAARAVRHSVYKAIFGGNLSILQKRASGAQYKLVRTRKVEQNPHQRGGNRRPYVPENSRLDKYFGADRGFILRFISSGTIPRMTRYGNRGMIRQSGWFGHVAPFQIDNAAALVADEINKYIKQETNG